MKITIGRIIRQQQPIKLTTPKPAKAKEIPVPDETHLPKEPRGKKVYVKKPRKIGIAYKKDY